MAFRRGLKTCISVYLTKMSDFGDSQAVPGYGPNLSVGIGTCTGALDDNGQKECGYL